VAEALILGRAIQIGGGKVIRTHHTQVRCGHCRQPWEVPTSVAGSFQCPHCRTRDSPHD
jgi:Zn finger protein HypA/HybF involved in hydrogenase expression